MLNIPLCTYINNSGLLMLISDCDVVVDVQWATVMTLHRHYHYGT